MPIAKAPCCDQHFGRGSRDIRIYRGPPYNQAGAGFFGDVFKKLIPLFTSKVVPYFGKKIMETGQEVIEDIKGGTPFKAAVKAGARGTLERGRADILRNLGGGGKIKRRRRPKKNQKLFAKKKNGVKNTKNCAQTTKSSCT